MAADAGLNLGEQLAAFRDYHAARGSTFRDWQAALRTWLRNAVGFAGRDARRATSPGRTTARPPKSFAQQEREAGWARWEQMTGRVHPDRVAQQQQDGLVIDAPAVRAPPSALVPVASARLEVSP